MKNSEIIRTDLENNQETIISMEDAIDKLSGYWQDDKIKTLLLNGEILFTPYANYKLLIK